MTKINWKVRAKNPAFWMTVIPALISIIYAILDVFEIAPILTEDITMRIFAGLCSCLAAGGIVIDPTTIGIGDSERAMTYETPNDSDNPKDVEENPKDETEID